MPIIFFPKKDKILQILSHNGAQSFILLGIHFLHIFQIQGMILEISELKSEFVELLFKLLVGGEFRRGDTRGLLGLVDGTWGGFGQF